MRKDSREGTREPLAAFVTVRETGRSRNAASIVNVSRGGCQISTVNRLVQGERIWVKFPGFDSIEATVRWSEEFTAGVEFVRPLHPAMLDHLLARLREN
ncbi:PilZ domain-containing protein [Sphingomicrobium lutaoense]|uniref:PilZ domain-containing protein n=1 Tax=Sphingomicrobium lutaoense TaxID=515949 RepID=UPI003899D650